MKNIHRCIGCNKQIRHKETKRCRACSGKARKTHPEIRFWKHVHKTQDCWLWTGSKTSNGYGSFNSGKKTHRDRAHRFSWEISNGKIPDGFGVLHKCDNPPCVRPDHLFIGTHKENMDDCARKGRRRIEGEESKNHKLTSSQVLEIRNDFKPGMSGILSKKYGISDHHILGIVHRKSWKHLV